MIILVTYKDKNGKIFVSHGVDAETLNDVVISNESLVYFRQYGGATFNATIGEWVINND